MSDDVRARAEAVALAYKNLRESISRWHGDGFAVSVNLGPLYESCDSLTAALAVAPATAQPVAWVVMGNRGTRRSPPYLSLEAAERCAVELDRGEFLEDIAETPHRVVPLYAAPPATGDAAAVALLADARKCVALANTNGYYDVWLARCDAILRAIPLPATANRDIERSST